jgi:hypothetical protein
LKLLHSLKPKLFFTLFSNYPKIATSGAVSVLPTSTSFGQVVSSAWFQWNQNGQMMDSLSMGKVGNTGNITIDTNPRLKVAYLGSIQQNKQYIDAGISSWNLRPRKYMTSNYLQTIEKNKISTLNLINLNLGLTEKL